MLLRSAEPVGFRPGATIDVVLVPQTTRAGVSAALTEVIDEGIALHAAVVSLSVSRGEHVLTSAAVASLNAALGQARARHVTVVASGGQIFAGTNQVQRLVVRRDLARG